MGADRTPLLRWSANTVWTIAIDESAARVAVPTAEAILETDAYAQAWLAFWSAIEAYEEGIRAAVAEVAEQQMRRHLAHQARIGKLMA